jgi:hypothetical protein
LKLSGWSPGRRLRSYQVEPEMLEDLFDHLLVFYEGYDEKCKPTLITAKVTLHTLIHTLAF